MARKDNARPSRLTALDVPPAKLKKRSLAQGLLLVGAHLGHIKPYLATEAYEFLELPLNSWPGPFTWLLPASRRAPYWITGGRECVAVRISANRRLRSGFRPLAAKATIEFAGAEVAVVEEVFTSSTSSGTESSHDTTWTVLLPPSPSALPRRDDRSPFRTRRREQQITEA